MFVILNVIFLYLVEITLVKFYFITLLSINIYFITCVSIFRGGGGPVNAYVCLRRGGGSLENLT